MNLISPFAKSTVPSAQTWIGFHPLKPNNAGGGKGPQFKTDAIPIAGRHGMRSNKSERHPVY